MRLKLEKGCRIEFIDPAKGSAAAITAKHGKGQYQLVTAPEACNCGAEPGKRCHQYCAARYTTIRTPSGEEIVDPTNLRVVQTAPQPLPAAPASVLAFQ